MALDTSNPYQRAALARSGVYVPPRVVRVSQISDSTNGVAFGAQASGYSTQVVGYNPNREYLLIQNNCASASIAVGFGAANALGIVVLAGGYYERQIYTSTQPVFITLLAASAAGDYVTVEEGSTQPAS